MRKKCYNEGEMSGKNKRKLKQTHLKIWQLILILIPLMFIAATLLRYDHLEMMRLKEAVATADKEGDDAETVKKIEELKTFTFSHIVVNVVEKNGVSKITFGTGPIYLEEQYQRKVAALIAEAEATVDDYSNPNGNVFAEAMAVCKPQAIENGWAWDSNEYIGCMTAEINNHPTTDVIDDAIAVKIPSAGLYRYDFISPVWAPCASGWTIIVCLIVIVVIFMRFIRWVAIRIAIRIWG